MLEGKYYLDFDEYKNDFDANFKNYKEIYTFATLTDFIDEEIEQQKIFLDNVTMEYFPLHDYEPMILANLGERFQVFELQKLLDDDDDDNPINEIKYQQLFNRIISFLTLKKNIFLREEIDDASPINNDLRRTQKNLPTNKARIKALKTLSPELWKRLQRSTKKVQRETIHLITAVNPEDSYKLSFGERSRQTDAFESPELVSLQQELENTNS